MNTITIHVYYTCKSGQAGAFVQAVKDSGIQEKIRAEEGCLRYDYYLSCEAPDTVLLAEQWQSAAAQERHMAQPHMAQLRKLKEEYTVETKLEQY
mgnify:CR=1 FL=1